MTDNTTIVTWLVIIGVCSLMQTLLTLVLLGAAWKRWRRAEEAIEAFQRDQLAPALAKIDHIAAEVQEVIGRVRRVDDQVRGALAGASDVVSGLARQATHRVWPVLGVINGLRAAASSMFTRRTSQSRQPPPRPQTQQSTPRRDDRDDEARFVYEGGTRYAR